MADSYVCSGATMRCTMGTSQAHLKVDERMRTVFLTGKLQANISDHLSFVNLKPFGRCRSLGFPNTAEATAANHGTLTPMPCMHNTPNSWMNGKKDYIIEGAPALLKSSTCQCMWGGIISITDDGQHGEGTQWVSKSQQDGFEKDRVSAEGLDTESVLDGIQMALDVAGMVPLAGAVPDLLNAAISACRGNWLDAGMSLLAAVPGAGDVVGGAKIVKNGVKIAKDVNKARKAVLAKEAKNYISEEITKKELLKSGICQSEKEVEFFQKALRGERKNFATEFYRKSGITEKKEVVSHVNGIDLNHAVKVKKMPPPNELIRFNEPGMEKKGSYFGVSSRTGDKINTPRSYGIQPIVVKRGEGFVTVVRKKKTMYKIADDTQQFEYLESTARPVKAPLDNNWESAKNIDSGIRNRKTGELRNNWTETKGGATQAFIPFKYRGCIKP